MSSPRWSATTKWVVAAALASVSFVVIVRAGDIVQPFVWAAVLSYVLLPLVRVLERRLSIRRGAAAALVFAALLATLFGLSRVLVPLAVAQLVDLQRSLPTLISNAQNTVAETFDQLGLEDLDAVVFAPLNSDFPAMAARFAVPFVVGIGRAILDLLIFFIATFFLLRDAPKIAGWIRRTLPRGQRAELLPLLGQVSELLGNYVRGQMILIGIMWTVTWIGLSVFGVPFSLLLGVLTGVLEVVPIIGPITAGAIACLVALGHPNPFGWSQLAYVGAIAIMYTVLRHTEDYFVIPLVIGRIVRLHPAVVIFSLLAGGTMFGLLGVLLAVPAAATLRLVLIYVNAKLRDEDPFPRLEEVLAAAPVAEPGHEARPVGGRAHP